MSFSLCIAFPIKASIGSQGHGVMIRHRTISCEKVLIASTLLYIQFSFSLAAHSSVATPACHCKARTPIRTGIDETILYRSCPAIIIFHPKRQFSSKPCKTFPIHRRHQLYLQSGAHGVMQIQSEGGYKKTENIRLRASCRRRQCANKSWLVRAFWFFRNALRRK